MRRCFVNIVILVFFAFLTAYSTSAETRNFTTTCNNIECLPPLHRDFFDPSIVWFPGQNTSSIMTILNTSDEDQFIGHSILNKKTTGNANLTRALNLIVTRKSDKKVVWKGTLYQLYEGKEIGLSLVSSGSQETYLYEITMAKDAGNEYQGSHTSFDLLIGYIIPTLTPTPTPTPTITPTPLPTLTSPPRRPITPPRASPSNRQSSDEEPAGEVLGEQSEVGRGIQVPQVVERILSQIGIISEKPQDKKTLDEMLVSSSSEIPNFENSQASVLSVFSEPVYETENCVSTHSWIGVMFVYFLMGGGMILFGSNLDFRRRFIIHCALLPLATVTLSRSLCGSIIAPILGVFVAFAIILISEIYLLLTRKQSAE